MSAGGRQFLKFLIGAGVAAGVVGVLVAFVASRQQKTYVSQASVGLAVSTQNVSGALVSGQLLANLPAPAALAQAFTQRLDTKAFSEALGVERPDRIYEARYDERRALLTLRASGRTPREARERGEKLLAVAQSYLQERLASAARTSAKAAAEQARLDLATALKILEGVRAILASGGHASGASGPGTAAALEAAKVDPVIARSPNPARTFLSLSEAQQEAGLQMAQARGAALERILQDPEALNTLVGQALQVQVLAPPGEPLAPVSPRPALAGAIAAVTVLALAVLAAMLRDSSGG